MLAAEFIARALEHGAPPTPPIPWLDDLRAVSLARFRAMGFPSPNEEDWRGTNLEPLMSAEFHASPPDALEALAPCLEAWPEQGTGPAACLVLVNGRLAPALSHDRNRPYEAQIGSLVEAIAARAAWIEPLFTRLARAGDNPFTALNTGAFEDGVFIHVPRGLDVSQPIVVRHFTVAEHGPVMTNPRFLIALDEGAQATVVESFAGRGASQSFTNVVTEIGLGANARLDHVRVVREPLGNTHVATTSVRLERDAGFRSQCVVLGGGLTRGAVEVKLAGEGAEVDLDGLYAPTDRHHVDLRTSVEHVACHTRSRQLYKGILDDASRGLFTGRVVVRPGAQKTDARQMNQNLLLSADALADSKPQLEIYADDVLCKHGSTTGCLREDALFYLRSRGLSERQARDMLTISFAREIVERIPDASAREVIAAVLARRWPGTQDLLREPPC